MRRAPIRGDGGPASTLREAPLTLPQLLRWNAERVGRSNPDPALALDGHGNPTFTLNSVTEISDGHVTLDARRPGGETLTLGGLCGLLGGFVHARGLKFLVKTKIRVRIDGGWLGPLRPSEVAMEDDGAKAVLHMSRPRWTITTDPNAED